MHIILVVTNYVLNYSKLLCNINISIKWYS